MTVATAPSPPVSEQWVADTDPVRPDDETPASDRLPPLGPGMQLARAALVMVFILTVTLLLQLLVIGALQHSSAQERKFDLFRSQLATGTAPIGPTDNQNRVLAIGAPVAYLEIPTIGLRQVIVEGTTPSAMFSGPGHRRDTPLPGQVGATVIMGRRGAFGGPFSRLGDLAPGDSIQITTGQGIYEYEVIGVRAEGDPVPIAPTSGSSRLVLATADGRPFLPEGVLRVDADLVGAAVVGPARLVTPAALPASERFMGADTSTMWALALWLQALIALSLGAVWAWHRWGHAQAWIVFLPPLLLVGLATSGEVARLLPNLL
jgi:LPXTG-site transpeptidase (sortase) family protein